MSLKTLINTQLLSDMSQAQKIVELWLSLRSQRKIKIKQPLASGRINIALEEYYLDIIREELNLKELIIDPSIAEQVTMIIKPNARLLGKRLWWAMQDVIREAKSGNYTQLDAGAIQVGEYVLSSDEYEVEYQSADDSLDLIVDRDTVLVLDTIITPALKLEWDARELVRAIQEARKSTWYDVSDRIQLSITGVDAELTQQFGDYITGETLATLVSEIANPWALIELDLEDHKLTFSINKI